MASLTEIKENLLEDINNDNDKIWKSCCFIINQNFLKYIVQVSISLMVITLSIYKLIVIDDNSDEKSLYVSLLTLILGIYVPTPSVKK